LTREQDSRALTGKYENGRNNNFEGIQIYEVSGRLDAMEKREQLEKE